MWWFSIDVINHLPSRILRGKIRILLDLNVRDQLLETGYTRCHTKFESAYS